MSLTEEQINDMFKDPNKANITIENIMHDISNDMQRVFNEAVSIGNEAIVTVMIERGVGISTPDEKWQTPLHLACSKGHRNIVELLLKNGAEIGITDEWGRTVLHRACSKGHLEIAELLLGRGASIDATDSRMEQTPLHYACSKGHLEIAELLLGRGANINTPDMEGETPLHSACSAGRTDIVKMLLKRGVDINTPDKKGQTPLNYACSGGCIETVEWLLAEKAKLETKDLNACLEGMDNIYNKYNNYEERIETFQLLTRKVQVDKETIDLACKKINDNLSSELTLDKLLSALSKSKNFDEMNSDSKTNLLQKIISSKVLPENQTDKDELVGKMLKKGFTLQEYAVYKTTEYVEKLIIDKIIENKKDIIGYVAKNFIPDGKQQGFKENVDLIKAVKEYEKTQNPSNLERITDIVMGFFNKNHKQNKLRGHAAKLAKSMSEHMGTSKENGVTISNLRSGKNQSQNRNL